MDVPSAPSCISNKAEHVTRQTIMGTYPKRSESLESLYTHWNNTNGGCCSIYVQEICLFLIASFLVFLGASMTFVAVFFGIRDLYILGPPMLLIGCIILVVASVYLVKKVKLRMRVAAMCRREEETKHPAFTSIQQHSPMLPKSQMNGHPGHDAMQLKPTETDLYGNNNTKHPPAGYPAVIVDVDREPRVFFPNNGVVDGNHESTFTTPLQRLQKSPQKTLKDHDSTSYIVPKLESRDSTLDSFASEPVVVPTPPPSPQEQTTGIPEAANYTPVSLTKVEILDTEKYGNSAVT